MREGGYPDRPENCPYTVDVFLKYGAPGFTMEDGSWIYLTDDRLFAHRRGNQIWIYQRYRRSGKYGFADMHEHHFGFVFDDPRILSIPPLIREMLDAAQQSS